MQYMYKNQLQVLMQRKNLSPPVYGSICEGQPHAPRFKATVTVDGQTFESPDFFTTIREAEHAAAKIALASLSDGIQEVDAGVYKNLLQELSQKEGFSLPVYNTVTSGPSHLPTFVCTVEIKGETFSGKPAKSKKQAEIFAAKVAWCYLEEHEIQQDVSAGIKPSNNRPSTPTSQLMLPPKTQIEAVPKTEELSFSARPLPQHEESDTTYSSVQDPLPTKTFSFKAWSAAADLSSSTKSSSSRGVAGNRIQVYPRGVKIQPPEGAIWLPISDNVWVAAQLRFAESQSRVSK